MFYLSIEQTMKDAFTRFAGFGPSGKIMPVRTAYRPSGSKPFRQSKTSCRRLGGLVVCCERKVLFEETQCIPHRRAGAEDRRPCLRIVRAGRLPGRRIRNCCRWRFPRYADVRHQRGRHAGQRIGIGGVPVRSGCGRLRDRNVPIGSCWNARHIGGRRRHRGRGGGRPSRRRGGAACRRPGAYAGCACQQGRSTRARRRGRPDGLGRGRLERQQGGVRGRMDAAHRRVSGGKPAFGLWRHVRRGGLGKRRGPALLPGHLQHGVHEGPQLLP